MKVKIEKLRFYLALLTLGLQAVSLLGAIAKFKKNEAAKKLSHMKEKSK